jgi:NOL1/NOP2/fmu family ribosome biogenesis protein
LGAAKDWVMNAQDEFFFLHGQHLRMMPSSQKHNLQVVLERLHILQAGTGVGEIMKNRIVPDHALALSVKRNKTLIHGIPLDRKQALDYLRKNPLSLSGLEAGFHVVVYEGLGLGWVNILPGRINNLFPSSRRVRMSVDANA